MVLKSKYEIILLKTLTDPLNYNNVQNTVSIFGDSCDSLASLFLSRNSVCSFPLLSLFHPDLCCFPSSYLFSFVTLLSLSILDIQKMSFQLHVSMCVVFTSFLFLYVVILQTCNSYIIGIPYITMCTITIRTSSACATAEPIFSVV